jgi:putative tricarboxylic transport membrane protein
MKSNDARSSLIWLGIALLICWGSVRLSLGDLRHPGPGFFSFVAGALLGLLSLLLFLHSRKKASDEKKKAFWPHPDGTRRMIWTLAALLLYVIGMKYAGFFGSTLLFLGFLLRVIGREKWPAVFSVTFLAAIISYGVFQYWLDVQLPRGFLGF